MNGLNFHDDMVSKMSDGREKYCCLITEKDHRDFIEAEIRADALKKFAEWMQENVFIDSESGVTIVAGVEYTRVVSFMELLEMYEKKSGE